MNIINNILIIKIALRLLIMGLTVIVIIACIGFYAKGRRDGFAEGYRTGVNTMKDNAKEIVKLTR